MVITHSWQDNQCDGVKIIKFENGSAAMDHHVRTMLCRWFVLSLTDISTNGLKRRHG